MEHLADFYEDMRDRLSASGIRIVDVKHEQWRERYYLARGGERAAIVFNYDGSRRMTSGWPLEKECNAQALLDDVTDAIEDIIKS